MAHVSPIDTSYVTPQSMITVAAIFSGLSILFVALRFYVRRSQKAALWWDDWLLLPGLVFVVGLGVNLIIGVAGGGVGYGDGLPADALPQEQFTWSTPAIHLTGKVWYIGQLLQIVALGLIKLSVLLLYRRLFCVHHQSWISVMTWIMGTIVVSWTIAFFFLYTFYCGTHFRELWHGTLNDLVRYCPDGNRYQLGLSVSDTVVDYLILIMPIPLVMQLQLSSYRKFMLIGVFMMGCFAAVTSTVRMGIYIRIAAVGRNPNLDGNKDVGLALFWSMAEAGAAVMAACLPTFKPLFSHSTTKSFKAGVLFIFSLLRYPSKTKESSESDLGKVASASSESNSEQLKDHQRPLTKFESEVYLQRVRDGLINGDEALG